MLRSLFAIDRSDGSTVIDYVRTDDETQDATTLKVGSIDFSIDDNRGDFVAVGGNATIDLYGAVKVTGGFAVTVATANVSTYNTDTSVKVDNVETSQLLIGLSDMTAFIGDDKSTTTEDDDVGLKLTGVNLALAIFNEKAGEKRSWLSAQATVGSSEFLGIDDLTLKVEEATVLVNKKASDNTVIDFSSNALKVYVGNDSEGVAQNVTFNMDGKDGEQVTVGGKVTIDHSLYL